MKFIIHFRYEYDGEIYEGEYITNDPQEFINPMRQQYGELVTFHIMGVN